MGKVARERRERPGAPLRAGTRVQTSAGTASRARADVDPQWILRWVLAPAIAVAVGLAVYLNSLSIPYLLDDQIEIVRSKEITHLKPLWNYLTEPRGILVLTLALNYRWGEHGVWGYHLFNLVVHVANGLLAYAFVLGTLRLPFFRRRYDRHAPFLALATALVFLTHPLQTMAVSYVIQRAESLAAFFYLLTLVLFRAGAPRPSGPSQWLLFTAAVAASLLGVLTKQVAATVPFVVLLYYVCFLRPLASSSPRGQRVMIIALFAGLVVAVILSWRYLAPTANEAGMLLPSMFIPSAGFGVEGLTPWTYLITQFGVIVWYLRLYLLPNRLTFDYGWPFVDSFWRVDVVLPLIMLLALAAGAVAAFRRYRLATFCIGWFFVTLAPSSSIIPLRDAAFEYRMYLPVLGLTWLAVVGLYDAAETFAPRLGLTARTAWQSLGVAVALWVTALGALTVSRNVTLQDSMRLAADSVSKAPGHWRNNYEYGRLLMEQGRKDEAIIAFEEAIRNDPTKGPPRLHLSTIYMERGQLDEAEAHLIAAREAKERSIVAAANRQLGFIYEARQMPRMAILFFDYASKLMPDWVVVRKRLAALYERDKNWQRAAEEYAAAMRLDRKASAQWAQRAAYCSYRAGVADYLWGPDKSKAVSLLEEAVKYRHTHAPAHHYLALAYADLGNWERAEQAIAAAARITPSDPAVIENVNRIRAREPRTLPTDLGPEF